MTKKISPGKSYTYAKNEKYLVHCLARYENGGVAVHHYKNHDETPAIGTAYLRDEDYERGLIVEVERPVRGYVNLIYDGNLDSQYFDSPVFESQSRAMAVFEKKQKEEPYLRLISIIEVKP